MSQRAATLELGDNDMVLAAMLDLLDLNDENILRVSSPPRCFFHFPPFLLLLPTRPFPDVVFQVMLTLLDKAIRQCTSCLALLSFLAASETSAAPRVAVAFIAKGGAAKVLARLTSRETPLSVKERLIALLAPLAAAEDSRAREALGGLSLAQLVPFMACDSRALQTQVCSIS